ncbi:hypothetical protein Pyn_30932 [Prunus yedoensis var. nudiflora]|uniref:Uncharacterized protein n=1 Tax=Prunus yedoensis var. nudiflora TaxID=2094558 RepID=A0A314UYF8_PRUYE|nr:hypothetical protein Pyn_30932 [Prunus yedoensis var. nudiflora]
MKFVAPKSIIHAIQAESLATGRLLRAFSRFLRAIGRLLRASGHLLQATGRFESAIRGRIVGIPDIAAEELDLRDLRDLDLGEFGNDIHGSGMIEE